MIDDIKQDIEGRMGRALEALSHNFNKIRTGRAHPSLLDSVRIEYYGAETPLNQLANINTDDARTLRWPSTRRSRQISSVLSSSRVWD